MEFNTELTELTALPFLKPPRLLSTSTDRAELLAQGICVCCRAELVVANTAQCPTCLRKIVAADVKAFTGFGLELKRVLFR